jgi:hypothetical protein
MVGPARMEDGEWRMAFLFHIPSSIIHSCLKELDPIG